MNVKDDNVVRKGPQGNVVRSLMLIHQSRSSLFVLNIGLLNVPYFEKKIKQNKTIFTSKVTSSLDPWFVQLWAMQDETQAEVGLAFPLPRGIRMQLVGKAHPLPRVYLGAPLFLNIISPSSVKCSRFQDLVIVEWHSSLRLVSCHFLLALTWDGLHCSSGLAVAPPVPSLWALPCGKPYCVYQT